MNNNTIPFSKVLYWVPFIMGLMVLGMNTRTGGTDLGGNIWSLEMAESDGILTLFAISNERPMLFYGIYVLIKQWIDITPLFYIACVSALHYWLYLFLIKKAIISENMSEISKRDVTILTLIIITAFNPLFLCINRYLMAVDVITLGLYLLSKKKYVISLFCLIVPILMHEGTKLLWIIIAISYILHRFVLPRIRSVKVRNIGIVLGCLVLYITGTSVFNVFANYLGANGLLSDKYMELYVETSAGDGDYAFVIKFMMLAAFIMLLSTILCNARHDFLNSLCITVLFAVSLFVNQKVFLVERMMMFIVPFMGLSALQVVSQRRYNYSTPSFYLILLLSVPCEFLFILYFQHKLLFAWL